jgi:hypothetical protein
MTLSIYKYTEYSIFDPSESAMGAEEDFRKKRKSKMSKHELSKALETLLKSGYSRWQIEDCLRAATPNPEFKRDMTVEAGWTLKRDEESTLRSREDVAKITIVDIFSTSNSINPHPSRKRVDYRTGEEVAFPEDEFGKPMGQRDAEFIIAVQEARKIEGTEGGYAGIPKDQIKRVGIDGYFGELLFPATIWIDATNVYYFPTLIWSGFGFFMAFVPCAIHWASAPHRIAGLPTLFPKI